VAGSASFLLVAAGRAAQRRLDDALATKDLSLRHVGALGHLTREPEMSYSDLARRAGVTPQSMRATVQQLEASGAVRRRPGGQGRAARLEVTARGHRLLAWAADQAAALDDELLAELDEEARSGLRGLLLRLALGGRWPGEPSSR
jgi:DNA-binding MarR family transcriptional regulator